MKFLQVQTIDIARQKLLNAAADFLPTTEIVPLDMGLGRVLATDIFVCEDLPHFNRSSVDGYALVASDTVGASEGMPVFLTVSGSIEMGHTTDIVIKKGHATYIPTGAIMPVGADAVVMVEYCEIFGDNEIAIYNTVAAGDHIVHIGEDATSGQLLLKKGKRLTTTDIGALAMTGTKDITVFLAPTICFVATGDELISPHHSPLAPAKIRETNNTTLSAQAKKHGYNPTQTLVFGDNENAIMAGVTAAMQKHDIVAISGGSSQGKKDKTADIINKITNHGVFTNGIAMRPGKPTILAYDKPTKTLIIGLPGHPISALAVFELLLGWLWRTLTNTTAPFPIPAKLSTNLPQSPGKTTFCPCALVLNNNEYTAIPIHYKSALIANITKADGYFLIDRDVEGLKKNDIVLVYIV